MERVFTDDVGRLFRKGDRKDYPHGVWKQIARNAKRPLDKFSRPADEAPKGGINGRSN